MSISNNSTKLIKTANRHLILSVIRKAETVTIENLIHATHLSRPTILNIIDELLEQNIIERIGCAESAVGRQPFLYALTHHTYFAIGIDFEFPPIRLVVTDLSGAVCYQKNWESSFDTKKDDIIESLVANIQLALDTLHLTTDSIIGIGLGIPGTININKNTSEIISRIPEWNKTPLSEILSQYFSVPIYVRNDAHLISMAVQAASRLEEQTFLFISYRTGIGMSIIQNGRPYNGCFGNAGYLGHTTADINGDLCICGNRGCLETFVSKTAIENKYAQARNSGSRISFDEVLQAAADGDSIAIDVLDHAGIYFGIAIANCIKLLDIPTVIIDGLNCSKDHIFIQTIEQTVNRFCASYAIEPIKIIPYQHEKENYALGAAYFILDTFFHEPKLKLSV